MNPIWLYFDFIESYLGFIITTLQPLKDRCDICTLIVSVGNKRKENDLTFKLGLTSEYIILNTIYMSMSLILWTSEVDQMLIRC